jgi:hypothetical protein
MIGMSDVACFAAMAAASTGDYDIDLEPHKFCCDFREVSAACLGPAILDREVATLDPAKLAQSPHESGGPWPPGGGCGCAKKPDGRYFPRVR